MEEGPVRDLGLEGKWGTVDLWVLGRSGCGANRLEANELKARQVMGTDREPG